MKHSDESNLKSICVYIFLKKKKVEDCRGTKTRFSVLL